jgi:uncharacterized protein YggT (Ycf19 family)
MIYLDFVGIISELFRVHIFETYIQASQLYNFLLKCYIESGLYFQVEDAIENFCIFFLKLVPLSYIKNLKIAMELYRQLFDLRITIGWFPIWNQQRGFWPILTEPIDIFIRIFYRKLPKTFLVDTSTWVASAILEGIINFLNVLIKVHSELTKLGL